MKEKERRRMVGVHHLGAEKSGATRPSQARPNHRRAKGDTAAQQHTNPQNPLAPLHHWVLCLLSPRGNPDGLADRAGDTLSGKTGRRTKEGEPGRCVATSSDFGLHLPSAPRTNPMNVPAVVAYLLRRLPVCYRRGGFHTLCLIPILFSITPAALASLLKPDDREIRLL
ncbi:hypothetical protein WN55_10963 [Dufourea novaeangliae]|uniref:Uncharacterized protein n=1 Tax=Dufourea novaeangliae TaxID=178035 RepID=A0A154PAL2_DUFNO|nr:hypothetical protein WN55_10963 [Dufourea novaeangliae]